MHNIKVKLVAAHFVETFGRLQLNNQQAVHHVVECRSSYNALVKTIQSLGCRVCWHLAQTLIYSSDSQSQLVFLTINSTHSQLRQQKRKMEAQMQDITAMSACRMTSRCGWRPNAALVPCIAFSNQATAAMEPLTTMPDARTGG
jgi:hypothetical protein